MNKYYEKVLLKERKLLAREIKDTRDKIKYLEDKIEESLISNDKSSMFDSFFDLHERDLFFLEDYLGEIIDAEIELNIIDTKTLQVNSYFKNGNIRETGFYIKGKREGLWVYHHLTGQVCMIGTYVKNKLNGQAFRYWRAGTEANYVRKAVREMYSNDKLNGISIYYDTDGSTMRKENYINNSLNGDVIHYDKNGDISKKEFYINDELIEEPL